MMRRVGRRRHLRAISDIPLTPLIDTALTLLIIFMVTAPMMQNAIRVSLPKGRVKEADVSGQKGLILFIDEKQRIFLDGRECEVASLSASLKERLIHTKNGGGEQVFVKADERVSYGRIVELIDQVKLVEGISQVVLVTQKLL